ncbi:AAA family ATPase [Tautonia plasticadhaerens]|uniref:ATPase RavA n=1 Tax=Tautonia plasticadhaerens TaxID=2527974 RepID=A0A518H2M9_9BACT|nr:AAA family ATPase [Tautonia plasticadhaerens]QDV35067.1 ATPase RavA [Tautonia plasticadhaerens]
MAGDDIDPHAGEVVSRLRRDVIDPLKRRFVGRDEVVDLIALAVVSGEHLFLLGPPGTAKSAVIRGFAEAVQGRYFEYLLTRFSEPNELFGPIDLVRLREGAVATVTTGMLPEAEFAFLDELFNANSAILNNLLTVLNERVYRRGAEAHRLPLLSLFTASNHLAEDEALRALFDRFLIRCHVDNLKRDAMPRLLAAGWELERAGPSSAGVSAGDLRALSRRVFDVDLSAVSGPYAELVWKVRDLGVALSDRRAVKVLKLVAASALLSGRAGARPSDLWVLRYVWDREEQIDPLRSLVGAVLDRAADDDPDAPRHPLAEPPDRVDAEDLARQLDQAEAQLRAPDGRPLGLAAAARLRERLAELSDRAAWVGDDAARRHLMGRVSELTGRLT